MASKLHQHHSPLELLRALESNRALQETISQELAVIAARKVENRETAAIVSQHLVTAMHHRQPTSMVGNPYRKEEERFFSQNRFGKPADCPEPNADTLHRRSLERKTFLSHRQPPWSKAETTKMLEIIDEQQISTSGQYSTTSPAEVDFAHVAASLELGSHRELEDMASSGMKKKIASFSRPAPRTAEECEVHYLRMKHEKVRPFTKKELLHISEAVHSESSPEWAGIAASLVDRTAWDCLVAYQTRINPVQADPWTPEEDELLLKYIFAAGPQLLIDKAFVERVQSSTMLPRKTKKQIFTRSTASLLNPKLMHENWSQDEERRLVLLMKIYRDADADVYMASTHFRRGTKSVVDKWCRSLSPAYLTRPFTEAEDKALVQTVRSMGNNIGWTELSEKHFPDRHPHRLMARWTDLASDKDILEREDDLFAQARRIRKRGAVSNDGNDRDMATLTKEDFVVQVVKKLRR
jgi:hypothetical protein